jgi:preprotein translocase subunit SecD
MNRLKQQIHNERIVWNTFSDRRKAQAKAAIMLALLLIVAFQAVLFKWVGWW